MREDRRSGSDPGASARARTGEVDRQWSQRRCDAPPNLQALPLQRKNEANTPKLTCTWTVHSARLKLASRPPGDNPVPPGSLGAGHELSWSHGTSMDSTGFCFDVRSWSGSVRFGTVRFGTAFSGHSLGQRETWGMQRRPSGGGG